MGPMKHLASAAAATAVSYIFTRDITFASVCGASCVLPDLDHLFEYIVYKKGRWNRKEFWSGSYFVTKGTIYVLLHSYEIAIILGILCIGNIIWKQELLTYVWAIAIGYYIHLVLDVIGNDCVKWGYSTIFRWKQQWKLDKICENDAS